MTLKALANLTLKFYSNGVIKSTDQMMTQSVMEGYLRNAYAFIIGEVIKQKKRSGELDISYLLSGAIVDETFDITVKTGVPTKIDISTKNLLRLDNAMQIVGFENPPEDCGCTHAGDLLSITYVSPYEVKFYLVPGYEDLKFFTLTLGTINIYNLPDCLNKINVQYAKESGDIDIAGDICFSICQVAFPTVFGVKKFGKPKIDDSSNENVELLKTQLGLSAP